MNQNSCVMSCHDGNVLWPIGAKNCLDGVVSFYSLFKETSADLHMTGMPALLSPISSSPLFNFKEEKALSV